MTPSITRTATPTRTPTPTLPPSSGPQITYFGLTTADNHVVPSTTTTDDGIPVFERPFGSGFFIVVESKRGASPGAAVPGILFDNSDPGNPSLRPDVQIEANRNLGNGSAAICDSDPRAGPVGGVPAISPPSFDPTSQAVANALNDFGCRFQDNTDSPCTLNANDVPAYVKVGTTRQVCNAAVLGTEMQFPHGDTLLTVQWRDTAGHLGFPQRIVVRIP